MNCSARSGRSFDSNTMKTIIKNILVLCTILAFCLSLSACAAGSPPPLPTPSAPAGPAVEETTDTLPNEPESEPVEAEIAGETPTDETSADPDEAAGCDVLDCIYERYYPGTAGSSLHAAKYAAMLLDWYVTIKADDLSARNSVVRRTGENFAASHDLSPEAETENGVHINFPEKFSAIWSSAMSLAFGDTAVLDDAGYESLCLWKASDANDLFTALYEGMGIERSGYITVYYPDDQVMYLLHADIPSFMDDASGILYALQTAKVLPREVELLSCEKDAEGVLHLDMNRAFREHIYKMGTSGEALTMAALADTFLSATGAGSLLLTVEGKNLETGHAIYDFPLTFDDSFIG